VGPPEWQSGDKEPERLHRLVDLYRLPKRNGFSLHRHSGLSSPCTRKYIPICSPEHSPSRVPRRTLVHLLGSGMELKRDLGVLLSASVETAELRDVQA
jgi:hypothetical protein